MIKKKACLSLLWGIGFLFSLPGTPDAASSDTEALIGEKADRYLVQADYFSQPGAYFEYTVEVSYRIRSKKDNSLLADYNVSKTSYNRLHSPDWKATKEYDNTNEIPINLEEWEDPVLRHSNMYYYYTDSFRIDGGEVLIQIPEGKWLSTGTKVPETMQNKEGIEVVARGNNCLYLQLGPGVLGFDIDGYSRIIAVDDQLVDRFYREDEFPLVDPGFSFSREEDDSLDIYPAGWSRDGKLAYLLFDPRLKKNSFQWVVQDMITDKIIWREPLPELEPFRGENFATIRNEYQKRTNLKGKYYTYKIIPSKRLDLKKLPLHENLHIRIQHQPAPGGGITDYRITAILPEGTSKVISSRDFSNIQDKKKLQDISVLGTLKSPYEKRLVVILAFHWIEEKRQWIEYELLGCHLETGFKN